MISTAQEIYDQMKDALDALGVNWRDKDKVRVDFKEDRISYEFDNKIVTYKRPEHD